MTRKLNLCHGLCHHPHVNAVTVKRFGAVCQLASSVKARQRDVFRHLKQCWKKNIKMLKPILIWLNDSICTAGKVMIILLTTSHANVSSAEDISKSKYLQPLHTIV